VGVFKIETFLQLGNNMVSPKVGRSIFVVGIVKGQLRILHELFPLKFSSNTGLKSLGHAIQIDSLIEVFRIFGMALFLKTVMNKFIIYTSQDYHDTFGLAISIRF
jgi:hypothetical protein